MRILLRNGRIVNVFSDEIVSADVLIEGEKIIGVGDYHDEKVDIVEDLEGRILCPGFIDGHIHIESTFLRPAEFARVCLPHGTTTVVADPHEIANVSGLMGLAYMIEASEGLPMDIYFVLPSCVPATPFDEAGATLTAGDFAPFFSNSRILGLGEVMNYPGVIDRAPDVMEKIEITKRNGCVVNGHAPMLTGHALDRYISAGIYDDHESSTIEEAMEKLRKGQWIMIRQGTAARNLEALLPLFDGPSSRRCLLVTDDKHPADLLEIGHIDSMIRMAVKMGKSPLVGIRMATLQAAQRFKMDNLGAVVPGYIANLLVLDDLDTVAVRDVYCKGQKVVNNGSIVNRFPSPHARPDIWKAVRNSFFMQKLKIEDFMVKPEGNRCRVIRIVPDQLITREEHVSLDFEHGNGIDVSRDILKLAVIERHMNTGHIGLGFISGLGFKHGAIASSVSHDSHNLIVAGASESDMAVAANCVREMGGGLAVVNSGRIMATMPLPIGGLMGLENADIMVELNESVRSAAAELGQSEGVEPFMNLAFVSLPVIPDIKMTTQGLVDVKSWKRIPLFLNDAD